MTTVTSIIKPDILICQPSDGFRFGIDSILLSWFATVKKSDSVLEVGGGSGVISTLIHYFRSPKKISVIELQDNMYTCLTKTLELNNLTDKITHIKGDVRTFKPDEMYNLVVCNPPYRPRGIGKASKKESINSAKFYNTLELQELLQFCKSRVYSKGRLAIVGDADRLAYNMNECTKSKFEPKRLQLVYSSIDKSAKLFLLECVYNGGVELVVEKPIIQNGQMHKDIMLGKW